MDFMRMSRDVTEELQKAIESGDCPRCEVSRFDYRTRWRKRDGDYRRLQVIAWLILDGKRMKVKFDKTLEQKRIVKGKEGSYYRGKMKSVAAMDCILRKAFIERWRKEGKEYERDFQAVKVSSYCFHSLGDIYSYQVPVCRHFEYNNKSYSIHQEGWDIIETIFGITLQIYQWVAWRLLSRSEGESKRGQGQKEGGESEKR